MPNKPVPLSAEQMTAAGMVEAPPFAPVEETNPLEHSQASAQEAHAGALSSLAAENASLDDSKPALENLQNRSNPGVDNSMTPAQTAIERYQASEEGSAERGSQTLDQTI